MYSTGTYLNGVLMQSQGSIRGECNSARICYPLLGLSNIVENEQILTISYWPLSTYYSARSKYGGDAAPRTSFFLNVTPGDVLVLRWDPKVETFRFLQKDESDPYVKSVKTFEFDGNLGTYPHEMKGKWTPLSCHLTPALVAQLQPIGVQIVTTGKALSGEERRQIDEAMEEMGLEESTREEELEVLMSDTQCYFTTIPRVRPPTGSTPSQVTAMNMDRSPVLDHMIEKDYDGNPNLFLGELQFSFVSFLLGQSFEGFEQWKSLVSLALSCESALYSVKRVSFWLDFLKVLETQLSEAPEDFFIDIVEGKNFLHHSLCDFFEIASDPGTPEPVAEAAEALKNFVEDRFGVPFDFTEAHGDDDGPTYVEM
jgi:A1 cistron-splicing factor AAR2